MGVKQTFPHLRGDVKAHVTLTAYQNSRISDIVGELNAMWTSQVKGRVSRLKRHLRNVNAKRNRPSPKRKGGQTDAGLNMIQQLVFQDVGYLRNVNAKRDRPSPKKNSKQIDVEKQNNLEELRQLLNKHSEKSQNRSRTRVHSHQPERTPEWLLMRETPDKPK